MFNPDQLSRFPTEPGVYLMKNQEGMILYVGKANNLRSRVRQYFLVGGDGRAVIPYLVSQIASIDTIVVASEKEALILENNLIKKHQPKYNALLKDDKTFFSLAVNYKHPWPMIRVVRYKGKPPPDALYFGPYAKGHAARETLELLRHLFPLRQCSDRELISRTRPCILYDLKQCIAPCVAKCTKEEYETLVERVIHFLRGHDAFVIKELQQELERAAEKLEFEKAEALLKMIHNIKATLETQRVEKAGTEDLDVVGLYRSGEDVVLTQVFYREGKLMGTHDHLFSHNAQDDEELLSSFLLQQYADAIDIPHEILLPLTLKDQETVAQLLSENKKHKVKVLCPKRGDKKALLETAEKNAEVRFYREKEVKNLKEQLLIAMEEDFHLTNYPERIECFDNSNIGGTEPVSALVAYTAGQRDPKRYRKYKIRTAGISDDYGALQEVLTRRYSKVQEEGHLPDLILIDGGKGHLNIALQVLSDLNISTVDVIAVAKEESKHTKGMTLERIFLPGQSDPVALKPHSPLLHFVQQIRDEAHRVALSFQRLRRGKRSLGSALDTLPGIGPTKKQRLLLRFGSLKRILDATEDQLREVKGITQKDIETLKTLKSNNSTS